MTDYTISIVTGSDGNCYKVCNGTFYDVRTPDKAVQVFEDCRIKKKESGCFMLIRKKKTYLLSLSLILRRAVHGMRSTIQSAESEEVQAVLKSHFLLKPDALFVEVDF